MALLNGFMPGEWDWQNQQDYPTGGMLSSGGWQDKLNGALNGNNPLFNIGLGILANNNSKNLGTVLGQGITAGVQNTQRAQQLNQQKQVQDFQIKDLQRKQKESDAEEAALMDFDAKFPEYAGLARIDKKAALRIAYPKAGDPVDYGLIPQIGIDPSTGQQKYFIQSKDGNTKWLDAAVPPKPQFVAPTEYNPGFFVDPRNPTKAPVPITTPQQPSVNGNPAPQAINDPRAPWNNLSSPKQVDESKQRSYADAQKHLDLVNQAVQEGAGTLSELNRFMELNGQTGTGGLADRIGLPSLTNDKREMESIQSRLAPKVREPGSGTTSDRDIALYLQGLPGVDKPGDVNKNIVNQYKKAYEKAQEKQSFYNAYLNQYGHLNGAAEIFENDYAKNHPQPKPKTSNNETQPSTQKRRSYNPKTGRIE